LLKKKGKLIIRTGNAGRVNRSLIQSFFAYLFHTNKAAKLTPSLILREDNIEDHVENFDINSIPSDVLIKQLKDIGFIIKSFTTRRSLMSKNSSKKAVKRYIYNFLMGLPFFHFTHMGQTIIVMAMK